MADENPTAGQGALLLFLGLITLALLYVVRPFASALLWAMLAAIMFRPLYNVVLRRLRGHENRATLATLLIITFAVVVPALAIGSVIIEQAGQIYVALRYDDIDASIYFERMREVLPPQAQTLLNESGYGDFNVLQARLAELLRDSVGLIAQHAVTLGGNAFAFLLSFAVGLYVTYFLLRDGSRLGPAVRATLPFDTSTAKRLTDTFVSVVRATIKGSVVVGLVQGALGAITFWIVGLPSVAVFGLLMAILSLLPAVGPAIIWGPAALYLLATGAIWQGLVVLASGILVIGMADNLLRPILVGRETGLPDWIVLVTTLGGIATLGLSGIVIGPLLAGLFLASWSVFREQRERAPSAERLSL
jgi:predicted PurR-regulated permease PerM